MKPAGVLVVIVIMVPFVSSGYRDWEDLAVDALLAGS